MLFILRIVWNMQINSVNLSVLKIRREANGVRLRRCLNHIKNLHFLRT